MTLWQIEIRTLAGQPDREAERIATEAREMGIEDSLRIATRRGFLLEGTVPFKDLRTTACQMLVDPLTEELQIDALTSPVWQIPPWENSAMVYVIPLPGVMDPVAQSTEQALRRRGLDVTAMRTYRRYWLGKLSVDQRERLAARLLFNASIEQAVHGPLQLDRLDSGVSYRFQRNVIPLRALTDDDQLIRLSREGQLSLSLAEMKTIRNHFCELDREPTDVELETIAQTWSEHCSHKTLAGRIHYTDETGTRQFENMLKETIFAATQQIRSQQGTADWCVSVFKDNAGVIEFDDEYCVTFKVETHNHPSAIEPYGGANTGMGGVLRDTLGTGLGAKPIASTDVFCFAPPDMQQADIPAGVLHPRRVMRGVVAGVRDYGNRMGIPTVNGAVYFDQRYLANPLVYCGSVGLLPRTALHKQPQTGDWIVSLGGKTGRDGIHGATFSSIELTSESETISGGSVQIGNAITEKMLMDVQLVARDRKLFHAVTDCGAGGYSSAVGEMGAELGAEVWLDKIPTKYSGLSYTELWISEAQERMVLAVPATSWDEFHALATSEGVEATIIGRFTDTHRLVLKYDAEQVADVSMEFLHDGRPPVIREAVYCSTAPERLKLQSLPVVKREIETSVRPAEAALLGLLGSWNIASKHWIIRQYDHEVQGGSVIKPMVGFDGPSDAAVVRPRLTSRRGLVIACGMNPAYGDLDPYHMAACAIDEAVRNCVAVGADPDRIAILDNFCWGNTQRPETLGSLVRAALACHDVAIAFGTPFISGKDSLNNEFTHQGSDGESRTLTIPPSLLISALGQVDDVQRCVTMDAKEPGDDLYLVGSTQLHFGGAHYTQLRKGTGGIVPQVDTKQALATFRAIHSAIREGLIRACHDLSEGGLAVAAAEMAFAGGRGIQLEFTTDMYVDWQAPPSARLEPWEILLFSESPSRFLCEVPPLQEQAFRTALRGVGVYRIGRITQEPRLRLISDEPASGPPTGNGTEGNGTEGNGTKGNGTEMRSDTSRILIDLPIEVLRKAWRQPLDFDTT